jgi:hypothetical protein
LSSIRRIQMDNYPTLIIILLLAIVLLVILFGTGVLG